ncbi:hypothetical protein Tco_1217311 [Tanacetum coccineum]
MFRPLQSPLTPFILLWINEWRRHRNGRSIKNKTTSSGNGFQFTLRVSNGVARERSRTREKRCSFERKLAINVLSSLFDLTLKLELKIAFHSLTHFSHLNEKGKGTRESEQCLGLFLAGNFVFGCKVKEGGGGGCYGGEGVKVKGEDEDV